MTLPTWLVWLLQFFVALAAVLGIGSAGCGPPGVGVTAVPVIGSNPKLQYDPRSATQVPVGSTGTNQYGLTIGDNTTVNAPIHLNIGDAALSLGLPAQTPTPTPTATPEPLPEAEPMPEMPADIVVPTFAPIPWPTPSEGVSQ